ncbi:murein L,D-transpeptidase YcbB/YkuD [Pontibacter ummariensis]|uniref:Murein L,D-transpeptidase YcbB/YkuD n=1 Tax=Pontibacter ummariensis TaxID=1610492 RepID=A0A239I1D4_9BACT|nr:L,D-transpeptidase family protein [Pontibacter ummariensis]PRY10156.1 murein L,D-transpeptidase YcbB/YkuD [Pontibacter ummariensis]SNS87068.1 Murein L,D-transpeptidase YcbB/YkuD [Pontibacter ummariensis]
MKRTNIDIPFPHYLLGLLLLLVPFLSTGATPAKLPGNSNTIGSATKVDSTYLEEYIGHEREFRHQLDLVEQFYQDRDYRLAWFENDRLIPQADKLIAAIEKANKHGLNPKAYSLSDLREMSRDYTALSASSPQKAQKKQELDLALTASYFNYASDFYKGEVDPHSAAAIEWEVKKNRIKLNKALEVVLQERENNPFYEFDAIHEGYQKLRNALVEYRQIQERGGWPKVQGEGIVKLNDTAKVVLDVRRRLFPQQPINRQDSTAYVYDARLEQAVRDFQQHHGLVVDGVLGPNTYKALNVSVDERIDQILVNMERWRWLPKDLDPKGDDERYLMVNIPAFRVRVMENGEEVMQMKAVVGETMNSTPVFSHRIQYLMFSPYWNVPNSIVEEDIKPHLQRDLGWLERNNMEMVTTFGANADRVPVSRVNWNTMTAQNFEYRIRERPSANNALGRVKFMFPNEYAVYLHDTPADHLFSERDRDFSHGCVRVERPADLATYLLQDKGWSRSQVLRAMNAREQQRVNLEEDVPVYLVYFTAWVGDDGEVHFRDDLYGHDKALAQKLF